MCLEAFEWPLETSKYVDAVVPPQPWGVIASLVLWHPEQLYPDTQWRPLTPKPPILQTTTHFSIQPKRINLETVSSVDPAVPDQVPSYQLVN